ncbi:hypothetical protein M422DRAFT_239799 [Sphaerobolus stellatus SS14]|nr:hypothetical protein M422DRAFT_239799 [Sphaerobolus stellatus SS14]
MSDPFNSFNETNWRVMLIQAAQNSELHEISSGSPRHLPEPGQHAPLQEQYPANRNSGYTNLNVRICRDKLSVSLTALKNINGIPNMPPLPAARALPSHNIDNGNHHALRPMHSYSRVTSEHLPSKSYDIAFENIIDLSKGDRNGTHQCIYRRDRGICRQSFDTAFEALLHVIEDHLENIRFRCSCGRNFSKKAYAEAHITEPED